MSDENIKEFEITASDKGLRLDKYLSLQLAESVSRARIQQFIHAGHVRKNGVVCHDTSGKLKEGDQLVVSIPQAQPTVIVPKAIALDIVYEDDYLLVVNKQAGLTVHPGAGNVENTLVNALLAYCGDELSSVGGQLRPGIVHRLDKDTTGLMVVAKDDLTHRKLSDKIASREVKRQYSAICWGVPKPYSGTFTGAIGRSTHHRTKMAIVKGGKDATTHYQTKEIFGNQQLSLVECQLETGRTHQIRVHFSHHGYPLVGDPVYSGTRRGAKRMLSEEVADMIRGFKRQALHAHRLSFEHPKTGEWVECEAPLPEDMEALKSCLMAIEKTTNR